ncbi:hypothetical protein [Helicobacter pylori]
MRFVYNKAVLKEMRLLNRGSL